MSASRPKPVQTAAPKSKLVLRSYDTINARPVEWGWQNAFPRRMLSAIVGDPGLGKSLITCDLAARFTRGLPMPCGGVNGFGEPVNTLILAIEDNPEDMIKPRLQLAGADMTRVLDVEMCVAGSPNERATLTFPDDLPQITTLVHQHNIRVIIVDPVTAYVGSGTNPWVGVDVRRMLSPLVAMADECDAVVILVMHLNKSETSSFLNRVGESKAFVAVPRMVWAVAPDPEDSAHAVLVALKSNIGPKTTSYGFGIHAADSESPPGVLWDDLPGHIRIEDIESASRATLSDDPQPATSSRADGVWLIARMLRDGEPVESERMRACAEAEGVSLRMLQRIADSLGVVKLERTSTVPSKGTWRWLRE